MRHAEVRRIVRDADARGLDGPGRAQYILGRGVTVRDFRRHCVRNSIVLLASGVATVAAVGLLCRVAVARRDATYLVAAGGVFAAWLAWAVRHR